MKKHNSGLPMDNLREIRHEGESEWGKYSECNLESSHSIQIQQRNINNIQHSEAKVFFGKKKNEKRKQSDMKWKDLVESEDASSETIMSPINIHKQQIFMDEDEVRTPCGAPMLYNFSQPSSGLNTPKETHTGSFDFPLKVKLKNNFNVGICDDDDMDGISPRA